MKTYKSSDLSTSKRGEILQEARINGVLIEERRSNGVVINTFELKLVAESNRLTLKKAVNIDYSLGSIFKVYGNLSIGDIDSPKEYLVAPAYCVVDGVNTLNLDNGYTAKLMANKNE